jgi:hypothetical protein
MDDNLRAIDDLFAAALYRAACPPSDQLLLYQARLLDPAAATDMSAHVQFCAQCQADLALIAAPPELGPGARLAAGLATVRERLRATLLSPPHTAAPALRGGPTRTLTYTVDGFQILIALIPAPTPGALAQIEGQVIGATAAAGVAELLQDGTLLQTGPIDDLGFFAFDDVAQGAYILHLNLEVQIVIDDLVI